jgi:hypothetical protein
MKSPRLIGIKAGPLWECATRLDEACPQLVSGSFPQGRNLSIRIGFHSRRWNSVRRAGQSRRSAPMSAGGWSLPLVRNSDVPKSFAGNRSLTGCRRHDSAITKPCECSGYTGAGCRCRWPAQCTDNIAWSRPSAEIVRTADRPLFFKRRPLLKHGENFRLQRRQTFSHVGNITANNIAGQDLVSR